MDISADAELAIRLRRAQFNQALAAADIGGITPILSPNVVLVTGSDSAVITGRKAQLQAWKREFAAAIPVVYVRKTAAVVISQVEPIAHEQGHWHGSVSAHQVPHVSGIYSAKWRHDGQHWLVVAEIFVTLTLK